jgi:2-amino-4-hydroxy-6-hydroxymethyldihydropteridine diphosphokinase
VTRAYVGLGANLGRREETLREAVGILDRAPDVDVVAVSELRETEPVGPIAQPMFLNGVVALDTTLSARELLELLLDVERSLGRIREERWGPRVVDLDLLLYGDDVVDEPGIEVPHPRLHERRFALEPLAELDPDLELPGHGRVSDLLAALD